MLSTQTLKELLKKKGYTISSAAQKIGRNKQAISLAFKIPPEMIGLPLVRKLLAEEIFEMDYDYLWGDPSKNGKSAK